MDKILNYRNEIYGLCILWVIFFHIESVTHLPHYIPLLSETLRLGNAAVDVFLFLSGYCLALSFNRHPDLGRYFRRRFIRIVIPYLLIAIPYCIWETICESKIQPSLSMASHFLYYLSGISFWLEGILTTWFVHAIILFYLLFPIFYHLIKKDKRGAWLLLACVYLIIILIHQLFPSSRLSAIGYSRLPVFTLGIIMACHGVKPSTSLKAMGLYAAYFIITIYFLHVNAWLKSHCSDFFWGWMFFITLVLPLLLFSERLVHFSKRKVQGILRFVGDMSLEVYLSHIIILHIICFYKLQKDMGWWTYLIVPIVSLIIGYIIFQTANHLVKSKTSHAQ